MIVPGHRELGDNNAPVELSHRETIRFAEEVAVPPVVAQHPAIAARGSLHIFGGSRSPGQKPSLPNSVLRYALALGTVMLASFVRLGFEPELGGIPGFPFFLLALVVSAGLAGFGPMLISMIASLFVFELVILPMHPLSWPEHAVQLLMYLSTAAGILLFRYLLDVERQATAREALEREQNAAKLRERDAELIHMARLSALGEMASSLAHELNQPLSATSNYLNGAARILEAVDGPGVATAREALHRAAEQAVRAGTIIHRMRDFVSRHEAVREPLDLGKTIEEASAIAFVGAKERGLRVTYSIDPSCSQVVAGRVQIQQVLLNLLRNAVDAMEQSPRRELTVSTAPIGDFVVVTIADTGTGIDPQIAPRLFQPFATTKPAGVGIGLSISRRIVEAHGGKIWVETRQEGGSTFKFSLPREARSDE